MKKREKALGERHWGYRGSAEKEDLHIGINKKSDWCF